jgi:hypothetical protein
MTGLPVSQLKKNSSNLTLKFKKAEPEPPSSQSTERSTPSKDSKELLDLKKLLETKEHALEKVRKERDDFWTILNSDKYRNFKSVED